MDVDAIIAIVTILGAVAIAIVITLGRVRIRELEIRQRIAMIEKGLVPPPEMDPGGFDRAMRRLADLRGTRAARHRRAGVTLIGIGLGLIVLLAFTNHRIGEGLGIGGFLAVLGGAFLLNSFLEEERPV